MYDSGELQLVLNKLETASCLEDIFGITATEMAIKKNYRQLVKFLHPDVYNTMSQDQIKKASEGFKILNEFVEVAMKCLSDGSYGQKRPLLQTNSSNAAKPNSIVFTIKEVEYHLQQLLAEGDISNVYSGKAINSDKSEQKIIVKLSYGSTDEEIRSNNQFLKNEATTLSAIWKDSDNPNLRHLPKLLAQFKTESSDGQKPASLANVLTFCEGHDFHTIRKHRLYKEGVKPWHLVWIMSRILTTLGFIHSKGIVHSNINPEHLIMYPYNHNVCLIDWCYGTKEAQQFRAFNQEYSAPEVAEKKAPTPSADIYSLGKSIIFLSGGNPATNSMPNIIPKDLRKFIEWMLMVSPSQRPRDAYDLNEHLKELRKKLYGDICFQKFDW